MSEMGGEQPLARLSLANSLPWQLRFGYVDLPEVFVFICGSLSDPRMLRLNVVGAGALTDRQAERAELPLQTSCSRSEWHR